MVLLMEFSQKVCYHRGCVILPHKKNKKQKTPHNLFLTCSRRENNCKQIIHEIFSFNCQIQCLKFFIDYRAYHTLLIVVNSILH